MCCCTRIVVGANNATWPPEKATLIAALNATSVLPNPTSPKIRRSIGIFFSRSFLTSLMAVN